jgi:hypothetical protein
MMAEQRSSVTEEMIDRAWAVLREEISPPYVAQAGDYVSDDSAGDQRASELAALRAADEECDRRNRDLIRRALAAAFSPHAEPATVHEQAREAVRTMWNAAFGHDP